MVDHPGQNGTSNVDNLEPNQLLRTKKGYIIKLVVLSPLVENQTVVIIIIIIIIIIL
jgi:hypothetical protein